MQGGPLEVLAHGYYGSTPSSMRARPMVGWTVTNQDKRTEEGESQALASGLGASNKGRGN